MQPLVEEAMKRAAIAWLTVPGSSEAYAVWCLWNDGALYVVSGPGEQPAPALAQARTVAVTTRGDHGGRILTWSAAVSRVQPDTDEWATIAPLLAGKRLNASGSSDDVVRRWAAECSINRLTPEGGAVLAAGETLPAETHAAPVRPTPAARHTTRPFRLHRVRRR
jgi:hypothetical protein